MHVEATDPPRPVPAPPRRRNDPVPAEAYPRPLLLRLYLAASRRAAGVARRMLERRRAEGKEDAGRLGERMGEAELGRGPRASSSGSTPRASARRPRSSRCCAGSPRRGRRSTCLVTTGTVTSAQFLADRLPENCLHQYAPHGRAALGEALPRPLAARPRGLDRERALAGDAHRDPRPRHPDAADQRPHLDPELPPLADDARPRRGRSSAASTASSPRTRSPASS